MKKLIYTLVLIGAFQSIQAQSFEGKGDKKLNAGYEIYGYGSGLTATFDYGLSNLFSIGAGATAFLESDENDYYIFTRANVHLGIALDLPSEFDIYPGFELGYLSSEKMGYGVFVGFRYFVSKKVGLYAELGTCGSAGVSFLI